MVKTKTKLLIWDWNGTLLDDTKLCFDIANDMRVERSMDPLPDMNAYRSVFGFPVIDYYRRMGYTFETETYEEMSEEFLALYAERLPQCGLQPHVQETLQAVHDLQIPQILLSATGADRLRGQVEFFGIADWFDDIIGGDNNLAHGKAENARNLLAQKSVDPANALFIGDTDHDHEVSDAIGCRCLLLTRGHQSHERLSMLGVPMIDHLQEVIDYIK